MKSLDLWRRMAKWFAFSENKWKSCCEWVLGSHRLTTKEPRYNAGSLLNQPDNGLRDTDQIAG